MPRARCCIDAFAAGRDARLYGRRDACRHRQLQFKHLPAAVRAGHREQHAVRIPMQVHIADELPSGLEHRARFRARVLQRPHAQFVVIAAPGQGAVTFPVVRQPERRRVGRTFDQQHVVEIQQRVCEQGPRAEAAMNSPRGCSSARRRRTQAPQSRQVAAAAGVASTKRPREVFDGPAQRGQVHPGFVQFSRWERNPGRRVCARWAG